MFVRKATEDDMALYIKTSSYDGQILQVESKTRNSLHVFELRVLAHTFVQLCHGKSLELPDYHVGYTLY